MAGLSLGASAPSPAVPGAATGRTVYRLPATTRTRRLQGVCMAGNALMSVYSSRRDGGAGGVCVALHNGIDERTGSLTPSLAREMAKALEAAAVATEAMTQGEG